MAMVTGLSGNEIYCMALKNYRPGEIVVGNSVNSNLQGGGIPGTQITGTNLRGPAGTDEIGCITDRGREIWLRVTFKPLS